MKEKKLKNYAIATHVALDSTCNDKMLCAVCTSYKNVVFLTITDCYLCGKCQDELSEAFDQAMTIDRDDYPGLQISNKQISYHYSSHNLFAMSPQENLYKKQNTYVIKAWVCDWGIYDTVKGKFIGKPINSYPEAVLILEWLLTAVEFKDI